MGRLKRAAKLCCGVLERQPREEKEVRLLEAHPFPVPPLRPLKVAPYRGTVRIRYVRYLPD